LIDNGAPLVHDASYIVFQFVEAPQPREVFAGAFDLIDGLRGPPARTTSA